MAMIVRNPITFGMRMKTSSASHEYAFLVGLCTAQIGQGKFKDKSGIQMLQRCRRGDDAQYWTVSIPTLPSILLPYLKDAEEAFVAGLDNTRICHTAKDCVTEVCGGFCLSGLWASSRQGLNSSNSSTTYAPIVPSVNVAIRPSSPSCSTLSIPMLLPMAESVLLGQTANCRILLTL